MYTNTKSNINIIVNIDTKRIFLKYLFPDLEIGPFIFIDLPDCFIEESNPQYAVNSFMFLNLFMSPISAIISDAVNSPIPKIELILSKYLVFFPKNIILY